MKVTVPGLPTGTVTEVGTEPAFVFWFVMLTATAPLLPARFSVVMKLLLESSTAGWMLRVCGPALRGVVNTGAAPYVPLITKPEGPSVTVVFPGLKPEALAVTVAVPELPCP